MFAEIETGQYGTPVTTDCVLDETFTLLRLKAGLAPVVRLSKLLVARPSVRRLRVGESTFEDILKLMLSRPDKRRNFTGCTGFVIMRETRIAWAFSWDHDLVGTGFEVLPSA
jgi:uncharacterized protein